MHDCGNGRINPGSGVRTGSCTPCTRYAPCLTTRQRCGTFKEGQPGSIRISRANSAPLASRSGMAAGSGVANPSTAGSRAAGRAKSAPLASPSGMAAGSGVANPRAAGPSDTDIYCSDCEMWLPKKVVSAPIALPDREKEEVGNPLRTCGRLQHGEPMRPQQFRRCN